MNLTIKTLLGVFALSQLTACLPQRAVKNTNVSRDVEFTVSVKSSIHDPLSEREFRDPQIKYQLEQCVPTTLLGTVLKNKMALQFDGKNITAGKGGCVIRAVSENIKPGITFEQGMNGTLWLSNTFKVARCENKEGSKVEGLKLCADVNLYKKYHDADLKVKKGDDFYNLKVHSLLKGTLEESLFSAYQAILTCAEPLRTMTINNIVIDNSVRPVIEFRNLPVTKAISCSELEVRAFHKEGTAAWTSFKATFEKDFKPVAQKTVHLFSEREPQLLELDKINPNDPEEIQVNLKECPAGTKFDIETYTCK